MAHLRESTAHEGAVQYAIRASPANLRIAKPWDLSSTIMREKNSVRTADISSGPRTLVILVKPLASAKSMTEGAEGEGCSWGWDGGLGRSGFGTNDDRGATGEITILSRTHDGAVVLRLGKFSRCDLISFLFSLLLNTFLTFFIQ